MTLPETNATTDAALPDEPIIEESADNDPHLRVRAMLHATLSKAIDDALAKRAAENYRKTGVFDLPVPIGGWVNLELYF